MLGRRDIQILLKFLSEVHLNSLKHKGDSVGRVKEKLISAVHVLPSVQENRKYSWGRWGKFRVVSFGYKEIVQNFQRVLLDDGVRSLS